MKRAVLVVAFIVIVAIGALVVFTKSGKAPSVNTPSSDSQEPKGITVEESKLNNATAVIIFTNDGYTPEKTTVKVGDIVAVRNQSSSSMQFSSDPHPVHTTNKELNQQTIPAGGSLTFTVTKKGTFGFHDHLNPSLKGSITVE